MASDSAALVTGVAASAITAQGQADARGLQTLAAVPKSEAMKDLSGVSDRSIGRKLFDRWLGSLSGMIVASTPLPDTSMGCLLKKGFCSNRSAVRRSINNLPLPESNFPKRLKQRETLERGPDGTGRFRSAAPWNAQ